MLVHIGYHGFCSIYISVQSGSLDVLHICNQIILASINCLAITKTTPTTYLPLIKRGHIVNSLQPFQVLIPFFPHIRSWKMKKLNSIKMRNFGAGRESGNTFWGLIFHSNEKRWAVIAVLTCKSVSDEVTCPCFFFFFHQHHKTSLRSTATQDNLLSFLNLSERARAAPGPMVLPEGGHSWHIPKSGETQPRSAVPGDLRESHNDSVSKEILPLLPQPCRAFDLALATSPSPPRQPFPSLLSLCSVFQKILIKGKDGDDERGFAPSPRWKETSSRRPKAR